MNVIDLLDRGLFALGELLRAPVVVLLWGCVLGACGLAGGWLADALARRRERLGFDAAGWFDGSRDLGVLPRGLRDFYAEVATLSRDEGFRARLEESLLRREALVKQGADTARILVKVGPSLGLLGTLIPMGSSLASLSQGNLEGMAAQMVAAFTSTIVGLAAGTAAFVVAARRQRWIDEDLRELRLLADLLVVQR
jgi:biopolymer transport protein ExbB/TolQ